jgi:FolB domain-containing protein
MPPVDRSHLDTIAVRGIRVDCIVGVYPSERTKTQPLDIDVELTLDTERAGRGESFADTVDYAALAAQVAFIAENGEFELLESAAQALARVLLLAPDASVGVSPVMQVKVTLTKPRALAHGAHASLVIERDRAWAGELVVEHKSFGTVDVLAELPSVGIYRLNVAPGRGIPLHVHRRLREREMVLTPGILCQGEGVKTGTVFRWPHDHPHRYDNPTGVVQRILCIDAPRFDPADEIEVAGEPQAIERDLSRVWGAE